MPSLDLGSGKYTELEWALGANDTSAAVSDVYEFRVTVAGVALDTYTVTPQITIAAATPPGRAAWQNMTRVAKRALAAARL